MLTLNESGQERLRYLFNKYIQHDHKELIIELSRLFKDIIYTSVNDGALIIENLPPDFESAATLQLFGSVIAEPIQYVHQGPLVMEIAPDKSKEDIGSAYNTSHRFDLHTDLSYIEDPPDIVGVYVVRQDVDKKSRSLFCHIQDVLSSLSVDTLEELQKPKFSFKSPPHYKISTEIFRPIVSFTNTGLNFRFRRDILKYSDHSSASAVECLIHGMDDKVIEFCPKENSIIFVNNKITTHGRTEFRPTYDAHDRLLKRIFFVRK